VGNEFDAAFYAGILTAAFSFAEALTGMFWGSLSDRVGRKNVLIFGNAGTMLSLLIVGFAPTFGVALLGRVVGGLLNGNMGVIQVCGFCPEPSDPCTDFPQTMVGELVTNPKHEREYMTF